MCITTCTFPPATLHPEAGSSLSANIDAPTALVYPPWTHTYGLNRLHQVSIAENSSVSYYWVGTDALR